MPTFRYTGDAGRVFPDLSLNVEPGDEVVLKENPDESRFVRVTAKAAAKSETAPKDEPATPKA